MKYLVLPALLFGISLVSCNNGYQASHRDIFNDQIWSKAETIVFEPEIKEAGKKAIAVDVQHIYGYDIKGLDLKMRITAPSGKEVLLQNYVVKFKNQDGTYISNCGGDYCDIEQQLEPAVDFNEVGKYQITFEQNTGADNVAGFLSFKLMIQ